MLLQLEQVSFAYNSCPILEKVDLEIGQQERWVIIGPSGCGKSSLLHLLAGLQIPQAGRILYQDRPLTNPHPQISLIPQDYGLFPWKTVEQNIALPLKLQKLPTSPALGQILQELGLSEQRRKFPRQLSGGQQQRVAIARSLITNPQVLLMDEPFSALDALNREKLQKLVLELWGQNNLTLVMVTHNIEEAVFLGQKILVFGSGIGHLKQIIVNEQSGQRQAGFYQQCLKLRALLED